MAETSPEDHTQESWENLESLVEGIDVHYDTSDEGPRLIEGSAPGIFLPRRSHRAHQFPRPQPDATLGRAVTTQPAPSHASLLGLPAELRLEIYQYLLVSRRRGAEKFPFYFFQIPAKQNDNSSKIAIHKDYRWRHDIYPDILATCRWIQSEATPLLYQKNVFVEVGFEPDIRLWGCCWGLFGRYREDAHNKNLVLPGVHQTGPQSDLLISRVRLRASHLHYSSGSDEYKVVEDFPALKELTLEATLEEIYRIEDGVSWYTWRYELALDNPKLAALKSASCKQPPLKRLACRIDITHGIDGRPSWDHQRNVEIPRTKNPWDQHPRAGPVDFGHHLSTKQVLEGWMDEHQIFAGRPVCWEFATECERCSWGDQIRRFVFFFVDGIARPGIRCRVQGRDKGDYKEFMYEEPETEL